MKKLLLVGLFLAFVSAPGYAAKSAGRIIRVYVNPTGLALFTLDAPITAPIPTCATAVGYWQYAFLTTAAAGKEMLSLLLTAKATDTPIGVSYATSCTSGYVALGSIYMTQ